MCKIRWIYLPCCHAYVLYWWIRAKDRDERSTKIRQKKSSFWLLFYLYIFIYVWNTQKWAYTQKYIIQFLQQSICLRHDMISVCFVHVQFFLSVKLDTALSLRGYSLAPTPICAYSRTNGTCIKALEASMSSSVFMVTVCDVIRYLYTWTDKKIWECLCVCICELCLLRCDLP